MKLINRYNERVKLKYLPLKMVDKNSLTDSKNGLSDISSRKDRIDALVNIAKLEFDKKNNYDEIIHTLNLEMVCNWTLSGGTRKEYVNAVRAKLEYLYGIKLQSNEGTNPAEIGEEILKEKPERKLAKPDQFFQIMRSLEGKDKIPVVHNMLIRELSKSGRFTQDEAEKMVQGMFTRGRIYESRPGQYNLV